MQALNLHRQFDILRMSDDESIKDFSRKVVRLVNQLRLLREKMTDKRIVNKVLFSLPEKFEAKTSSLEDSKDLPKLTLSEFMNSLQGQEQKRALRQDDFVDSALVAKTKNLKLESGSTRENDFNNKEKNKKSSDGNIGKHGHQYLTCSHCKKKTHFSKFC